jgi:hypothetical protein
MSTKQKRIFFTIGEKAFEEKKMVEQYYERPISALLCQEVAELVKKRHDALPAEFKKRFSA